MHEALATATTIAVPMTAFSLTQVFQSFLYSERMNLLSYYLCGFHKNPAVHFLNMYETENGCVRLIKEIMSLVEHQSLMIFQ